MNNKNLEVGIAVYTGVCIYNVLSNTIVEIEGKFVPIEDKIYLSLYLGVLHSNNSLSYLLKDTDIVKSTNIKYKVLDSREYCELYDKHFRKFINNVNKESIYNYLEELLDKNVVIKLNNEYDFDPHDFINRENKTLVKK